MLQVFIVTPKADDKQTHWFDWIYPNKNFMLVLKCFERHSGSKATPKMPEHQTWVKLDQTGCAVSEISAGFG